MRLAYFWGIIGLCLVLAFFNQVYSDESVYQILLGRFSKNSGYRLSSFPQCINSYKTFTPYIFWPPSYALDVFYGLITKPLYIRMAGLFLSGLNFSLLYTILSRSLTGAKKKILRIFIAVYFLGSHVFLMQMLRPESYILTSTLLILNLAVHQSSAAGNAMKLLKSICCLFFIIFNLSVHPVSLAFTPLYIVALYLVSPGHTVTAVSGITFTYAVSKALPFHKYFSRCPENSALQAFYDAYLTKTDPSDGVFGIITRYLVNFRTIEDFIYSLFFSPYFLGGMIPHINLDNLFNYLIYILGIITVSIAVITIAYLMLINLFKSSKYSSQFLLALALIASLLCGLLIQPKFFSYRLVIWYPVLIASLGIILFHLTDLSVIKLHRISLFLAACAVTSCAAMIILYSRPLSKKFRPYYSDDQKMSVGLGAFDDLKGDIEDAQKECGIKNSERSHRVVIDALTYFYFKDTSEPVIVDAIWWQQGLDTEEKFSTFLDSNSISSFFVTCASLNKLWPSYKFKKIGRICCATFK